MIGKVQLSKLLKAMYSFAIAFLGSLSVVLVGNESIGSLTAGQWTSIATFALGAFGGTYGLAGWSGPGVGKGSNGG